MSDLKATEKYNWNDLEHLQRVVRVLRLSLSQRGRKKALPSARTLSETSNRICRLEERIKQLEAEKQ